MTRTLLDIRYYDQTFHPAFFRVKGWRGRLIVFLNWLRYWIETLVQYHVMRLGFTQADIDPPQRSAVVRQFWKDVKAERAVAFHEEQAYPTDPPVSIREMRYRYGRRTMEVISLEDGETAVSTPAPIDNLAARMTAGGRSRRYAMGTVIREEVDPVATTEKE